MKRLLGLLPLALLCACPSGPTLQPGTPVNVHDTVTVRDTVTRTDTVTVQLPPTTRTVYDTVTHTIVQHDTVRVQLPPITLHDTTIVTRIVHDTTKVQSPPITLHDTTIVTRHDTTVIKSAPVHDTTVVVKTVQLPPIHDTTVVVKTVTLHDTVKVQLPPIVQHDTVKIQLPPIVQHDTVYVRDTAPSPIILTPTGCGSESAVVVRYTDVTDLGAAPRTDIAPLVICGPPEITTIARTYVDWVAGGNCPCQNGTAKDTTTNPYDTIVLAPQDTSKSAWTPNDSVLVRIDSTHWQVRPGALLPWKHFGNMLYDNVLTAAKAPGIAVGGPAPVPAGWWSYVPTRDGWTRVLMKADSGGTSVANLTLDRYLVTDLPADVGQPSNKE